ncbi:MAG: BofC C-terminal domain [Oscillospiraceae bacterium]|nr:BofC C-terminal domain [Oscillospiraceae bacterium]
MKKSILYSLVSVSTLLLIIAIMFVVNFFSSKDILKISTQEPKTTYMYVLKEHENNVGVYDYKTQEHLFDLEITIDSLPEYDQSQLKSGIKIKDDTALKSIIEDFTG